MLRVAVEASQVSGSEDVKTNPVNGFAVQEDRIND